MTTHNPRIFFITGTSGSGKSTLTTLLQTKLSTKLFSVHDFDEVGVPANPDTTLRKTTTDYWLTKAIENTKQDKSTVICGVIVPTEVLNSTNKATVPIFFGFIHIDENTITSGLQDRGWNEQLIQDNINWAQHLEKDVLHQQYHAIIDASSQTPEEVSHKFESWIFESMTLSNH